MPPLALSAATAVTALGRHHGFERHVLRVLHHVDQDEDGDYRQDGDGVRSPPVLAGERSEPALRITRPPEGAVVAQAGAHPLGAPGAAFMRLLMCPVPTSPVPLCHRCVI